MLSWPELLYGFCAARPGAAPSRRLPALRSFLSLNKTPNFADGSVQISVSLPVSCCGLSNSSAFRGRLLEAGWKSCVLLSLIAALQGSSRMDFMVCFAGRWQELSCVRRNLLAFVWVFFFAFLFFFLVCMKKEENWAVLQLPCMCAHA